MDLLSHNASAVVLDRPVLAYYLKNQPKAAQQLTIPPYIADAEEFGFCVKKGNTALLDKLNKAYAELKLPAKSTRSTRSGSRNNSNDQSARICALSLNL